MLKVLINGCNGKMGQEVARRIKETEDIETLCGVDKIDTGDNAFPVFQNVEDINLIPDVIIDFSIPKATFAILDFAKKNKIVVRYNRLKDSVIKYAKSKKLKYLICLILLPPPF